FHGMEEVVGSIPTRSTNLTAFVFNQKNRLFNFVLHLLCRHCMHSPCLKSSFTGDTVQNALTKPLKTRNAPSIARSGYLGAKTAGRFKNQRNLAHSMLQLK